MKNAILVFAALFLLAIAAYIYNIRITYKFIRGEFGKYCYEEDNVPKTIKHPLFFDTLEECPDYIN